MVLEINIQRHLWDIQFYFFLERQLISSMLFSKHPMSCSLNSLRKSTCFPLTPTLPSVALTALVFFPFWTSSSLSSPPPHSLLLHAHRFLLSRLRTPSCPRGLAAASTCAPQLSKTRAATLHIPHLRKAGLQLTHSGLRSSLRKSENIAVQTRDTAASQRKTCLWPPSQDSTPRPGQQPVTAIVRTRTAPSNAAERPNAGGRAGSGHPGTRSQSPGSTPLTGSPRRALPCGHPTLEARQLLLRDPGARISHPAGAQRDPGPAPPPSLR